MRNLYGMDYVVKRLRITTEQNAFIRAYADRVGISYTRAIRNVIDNEVRRSRKHRLTLIQKDSKLRKCCIRVIASIAGTKKMCNFGLPKQLSGGLINYHVMNTYQTIADQLNSKGVTAYYDSRDADNAQAAQSAISGNITAHDVETACSELGSKNVVDVASCAAVIACNRLLCQVGESVIFELN